MNKILLMTTDEVSFDWHIAPIVQKLQENNSLVVCYQFEKKPKNFQEVEFLNIPIKRRFSPIHDIYCIIYTIIKLRNAEFDITLSVMPKAGLICSIVSYFLRVKKRHHIFTGLVWCVFNRRLALLYKLVDKIILALNTQNFADSASQATLINKVLTPKTGVNIYGYGSLSGTDFKVVSDINLDVCKQIAREKYKMPLDKVNLLFLSRKVKAKGADTVLRIFDRLMMAKVNCYLQFIGPDIENYKTSHSRLFTKYAGSILSVGAVQNADDYIKAADILILPSVHEGFGSVVIDVARFRIPSVGYNVTGLSDAIVHNETGLLSDYGDEDDMLLNLKSLINDNSYRKKLGERAFDRTLKYYNRPYVLEELERVIND